MITIRVDVTQEDIDGGCRRVANNCAIARAFRRAGVKDAECSPCSLHIEKSGGEHPCIAELPEEAQRFIRDFDVHRPVAPFSFEIEVPEQYAPTQPTPDPLLLSHAEMVLEGERILLNAAQEECEGSKRQEEARITLNGRPA